MAINRYNINHASLTDIGLKRNLNEDSIGFIEINDGYVFIVCDGMGGHEGGEIASKAAIRFIIESLNAHNIENSVIALHQAITFANQQIYLTAQNRPDLKGMGTTVAVLLIYKDEIYTAHVGDSRIYVLSNNQYFQITKDHSIVQEMVDKGIIRSSEAENHPRKNEITKALGIKEEVAPAINGKSLKAKAGDRFIICSDGLSGLVSFNVFNKAVAENKLPETCAKELVALAKKGGGDDNISVQVVDIIQSPFTESFYPSQPTGLPVAKKKMKKSMVLTLLLGGLIILTGIGWGVGTFVNRYLGASSTKDSILSVPESVIIEPNCDSLITVGYLTKQETIDSVKKYLGNKKDVKNKNHYIDSLNSSSYEAIKFLKDNRVIKEFNTTCEVYELSNKIKDSLKNVGKINKEKNLQTQVNTDKQSAAYKLRDKNTNAIPVVKPNPLPVVKPSKDDSLPKTLTPGTKPGNESPKIIMPEKKGGEF